MNIRNPLVVRESIETNPAALQGTVIGVLGSKGGVGSTTLAINIAAAFSRMLEKTQNAVTIIDANLQQPDVALMLACEPKNSMNELLKRTSNLEPQIIEACRNDVPCTGNIKLISPPIDGNAATRFDVSQLAPCISDVSRTAFGTIIDLPKTIGRPLVMLLDACDVIVLVVEPNLSSIAATKRWLSAFADLGYDPAKIILVANRLGSKSKLLENQLNLSFAGQLCAKIPNAYAVNEICSIEGEPLILRNPKEAYSKAVRALADQTLLRLARQRTAPTS